jgi:conjugal transfer/entry exclusion protein
MKKSDEIDDTDFVKFSQIMDHLKELKKQQKEIDDLAFERYIENSYALKHAKF